MTSETARTLVFASEDPLRRTIFEAASNGLRYSVITLRWQDLQQSLLGLIRDGFMVEARPQGSEWQYRVLQIGDIDKPSLFTPASLPSAYQLLQTRISWLPETPGPSGQPDMWTIWQPELSKGKPIPCSMRAIQRPGSYSSDIKASVEQDLDDMNTSAAMPSRLLGVPDPLRRQLVDQVEDRIRVMSAMQASHFPDFAGPGFMDSQTRAMQQERQGEQPTKKAFERFQDAQDRSQRTAPSPQELDLRGPEELIPLICKNKSLSAEDLTPASWTTSN